MPGSEAGRSRRALAGLLGFLARGPAAGSEGHAAAAGGAGAPPVQIDLARSDGTRRKADARLVTLALARGLIAAGPLPDRPGAERSFALTQAGRAALRRFLSDPDSAFQDQHRTLLTRSDPDHGRLTVNVEESPLTALARFRGRGGAPFLEPCQVEASERLRADFTRAHMQPSLAQRWEPVRLGRQAGTRGGAVEITEAALSARLRVERALDDVGPELSGVLFDVCCFLKGLAEVERERQWPARSAKLMLRTALAALARHYAGPKPSFRRPPAPPRHAP